MTAIAAQGTPTSARWSLGGIFLEALATPDYELMATTLGPMIRFRVLLPPGPMEWQGPQSVVDAFSSWFGGADDVAVDTGLVASRAAARMNEVTLTPACSARARRSAISVSENRTEIVTSRLTVTGTSWPASKSDVSIVRL